MATNNFSETNRVTCEAYRVRWDDEPPFDLYRGELYNFDKEKPSTVVIKKLRYGCSEDYFFKDIEILTRVQHHSISNLVGFCNEERQWIMVVDNFHEYLDDYLKDVKKRCNLTWEKLLQICIDVAHAFNYLYCEMGDVVMTLNCNLDNHFITSGYIALDENFRAKIVDFKVFDIMHSDPKDEAFHLVPAGLGVVLFKVLCAASGYEVVTENFVSRLRECFDTEMLPGMIDSIIRDEIDENTSIVIRGPKKDSLNIFIKIARMCLGESEDELPTMKFVITELEKALVFQRNNNVNLVISLEDIKLATQDFHPDNYIGGGGFGKVYVGKLQVGDKSNTIVAKRLYGHGKEQFLIELQILWEYKHENIISLVGYCDEDDEKIIVYEYASRSSLDRYLNHVSLTWLKRLSICIEVASALDFLHGGAGKQAKVVHRDIKAANILLNQYLKAKLADFGLSMISAITKQIDHVFDHACGTPGYVDPLYANSKVLTIESDVYSFGVVLFEMLCGRSTHTVYKQEGHYLPDFVKTKFKAGKHGEVVFEQIREEIMPNSLTTFQEIAYQCLHNEREKRPSTKKVLMELKKALEYQNSRDVFTTQIVSSARLK